MHNALTMTYPKLYLHQYFDTISHHQQDIVYQFLSEGDISTPNIRFLFTECLYQFEPMDYSAWYYDFPRIGAWGQCIVSPSGNVDSFNLITEQGSTGSNIYDTLRMINDLRYKISHMSGEDKASYGYI